MRRKHGARPALGQAPPPRAREPSALRDTCLPPRFCCTFFPFLMKRSSFLIELIMLIEFPPSLCL